MSTLEGWDIPDWALHAKPSMTKIYRISTDDFVVFKNSNHEVDWLLSEKFDENCTDEITSYIDNIYSKIIFLLSYLPKDIDANIIEDINIMCSEALAAIFNKNSTLAIEIITSIEERISAYKYQKYITIVYNTIGNNFTLLTAIILISYIINLNVLNNYKLITFIVIAFCIGGIGSIASILSTKKDVSFKETLKNESVIQDIQYKILLGGIFSCISYAMITSNIIEPFKDFSFHQSIIVFFLCGFSERFAPSIFEKFNKS